jgi:hypothetical protein
VRLQPLGHLSGALLMTAEPASFKGDLSVIRRSADCVEEVGAGSVAD